LRLEREVAATFARLCRSDAVVIIGETKEVVGIIFEDEEVVLFGEAESGYYGCTLISDCEGGLGFDRDRV